MSAIQNLKRVFSGDIKRQYQVYGEIVFKIPMFMSRERSSSVKQREVMIQAIRDVDELHPWRDVGYGGMPLSSIGLVKFTDDQFNNWACPELNVWFRIEPTARSLSRSQVYAYEKYLETLAQKLAERGEFVGIAKVRSFCRTTKGSPEFRG